MTFIEIIALAICAAGVIIFALLRWPADIPVWLAIILLSAMAISVAAGREQLATNLVIFAFYSLGWGVIVLIIQYIREHRGKPN